MVELEQTNCFSLLGITGAQRSRDFPTHLSLSDLHLLPIEYDRSLARSRIDLVEAITRYTNKPINCGRGTTHFSGRPASPNRAKRH